MVGVIAVPGQLAAVGVTVMVPVTFAAVAFVAVNDAMFPLPLAPRPIEIVLFVHA
jgi:hypothetical protein